MRITSQKVFFIILIGVILRFAASMVGANYDYESWLIVGDLVSEGSNFYCHTHRYNYGPIWAGILGVFAFFSDFTGLPVRVFVVAFLSFFDVLIFVLLKNNSSLKVGSLFFLNPISIIISGYHNQIDNVSIAIVFAGIIHFYKTKNWYVLSIIIGLALTFKHAFIFFPIWMIFYLFNKKSNYISSIIPAISILIFAIAFVPFLSCWENIFTNVFKYYSRNNAPLYSLITFFNFEGIDSTTKIYKLLFIGFTLILGFVLSKKYSVYQLFLLYPLILLIFSQSITNQYLAIPLITIALLPIKWYLLYTIPSTIFLIFDANGFNLGAYLFNNYNYQLVDKVFFVALVLILIAILINLFKKQKLNQFQLNINN